MCFCCFSCHVWLHRSTTSFVNQNWIFLLCLLRTSSAAGSSPSFQAVHEGVYIAIKDAGGCKLSTYLSLEHFHYFQVFEFLQVKSDARAFHDALGFQFQLDNCRHKVMIAANVSTWERPCVCFVDAGLEALGCQNEVYLVVNLPIRGMPGCCPRQLVAVEECWQGWVCGSLRTLGVSILRCLSLQCQIFLLSLSSVGMHQAYFGIPVTLNYKHILLRSLCYDITSYCTFTCPFVLFVSFNQWQTFNFS